MTTKLLLTATILCSLILPSTSKATSTSQQVSEIISGSWYEIDSKEMSENRKYAVHLPQSYLSSTNKTYPVLYVLDGDETRMRGIGGMIESLSHYDLNQQIPEFIVVSIPNLNRSRDLSPTKADLSFKGKVLDEFGENSGGADTFAKFIRDELIQEIESKYRTNKVRGIMGMSLAGLFSAYVLLNHPDMFSHYIISDATFVWDENYLNRTLDANKNNLINSEIKVFIGLANNDHLGELGITNRRWGNDFISALKRIENPKLTVSSKYFPNEKHATVMFLAFYYGLIDLFQIKT